MRPTARQLRIPVLPTCFCLRAAAVIGSAAMTEVLLVLQILQLVGSPPNLAACRGN